MVLIVSRWYSGVVEHLRKKCGLLCSVAYRILFRRTDVTKDLSERDLGVYRIESVYGKMSALYERVFTYKFLSEKD